LTDFDRKESIRRLTDNAFDRAVFDANLGEHRPHTIDGGVIFEQAFWAAFSVRSLADFSKSIVRIDTDRRLRFVDCDIDDISSCNPILYHGAPSGGNENAFWISNGQFVARHSASRSCDFDTANQSLVQWCDAPSRKVATAESTTEMG
jgi:hypothetical protein